MHLVCSCNSIFTSHFMDIFYPVPSVMVNRLNILHNLHVKSIAILIQHLQYQNNKKGETYLCFDSLLQLYCYSVAPGQGMGWCLQSSLTATLCICMHLSQDKNLKFMVVLWVVFFWLYIIFFAFIILYIQQLCFRESFKQFYCYQFGAFNG